jgi:hypothetical protein
MPTDCDMAMFRDIVHHYMKHLFRKQEMTKPEGCEDHRIACDHLPHPRDPNCILVYADCYHVEHFSYYRKPDLWLHVLEFRDAAVTDGGVNSEKAVDWFARKFKEWDSVPWSKIVPEHVEVS